jgi:2-dehydro-3-deoxyphosphogluconate aldolase/(4S)-4-hydroxy-2-oxoglutarate aldolase
VTEDNVGAYLAQPNVVACGGSWLAPVTDIRAGNWDAITERTRRIMEKISGPP